MNSKLPSIEYISCGVGRIGAAMDVNECGANGLFLGKTHSGVPAQKFFFVHPQSAWVQNSLVYPTYGEFGLRVITVSAPGTLLRWFIDQW